MRVEQFLQSIDLEIPKKNTMRDVEAYRELVEHGGRATVPCLRITQSDEGDDWLYESLDIIQFIGDNHEQIASSI